MSPNGVTRFRSGTAVNLHTCFGGPTQDWTVESDGTIRIAGLCLDTAGEGTAQGTLTVLGTCNSSATQVWTPGGPGGNLVNQAAGMCLDDPNFTTTNGTQMQIYSCNGGSNQQWYLPAV